MAGGLPGCQALFERCSALATEATAYASVHRLLVDAYCMQHPERYCVSAKSYAAHLMGLCCGIEHAGARPVYASIQRWLDGAALLERPAHRADRGRMTLPEVMHARTPGEHQGQVEVWARIVWQAYADQHALARKWLLDARSSRSKR